MSHCRTSAFNNHLYHRFIVLKGVQLRLTLRRVCVCVCVAEHMVLMRGSTLRRDCSFLFPETSRVGWLILLLSEWGSVRFQFPDASLVVFFGIVC